MCSRIIWPESWPRSREEILHAISEIVRPDAYQYIGVTFSPLWRMHTIRNSDEGGSNAAHYPSRWRTMRIVACGGLNAILEMERQAISLHQRWLTNALRAAGTGTAQKQLFLYVCSNDGPACKCVHCRAGRAMDPNLSSSSGEDETAVRAVKRTIEPIYKQDVHITQEGPGEDHRG